MNSPLEDSAKSVPGDDMDARRRLQRLWKGTLFVWIAASYVLVLVLLFVFHGWRSALLAAFFVVLSQLFRYIADDVDRIGWKLSSGPAGENVGESTRRLQVRMRYLSGGLAQLQNVALLYQAYHLAGAQWMLGLLVGLAVVEVCYLRIRSVNRSVQFEQASYGFRDGGVFEHGRDPLDPAKRAKHDGVERKLDVLEEMAEDGLISRQAYEKARDKYRVNVVMLDEVGA